MSECTCCGRVLAAPAEQDDLCHECLDAFNAVGPEPPSPPAASVSPRPRFPVTKILILLNIFIFALVAVIGHYHPALTPVDFGADWGLVTISGQWWRLLTSTFLHRDLIHLFDNLLVLWIIGKRAEPLFGKFVFVAVYVSCGLAASIASLAVHPEISSLGASGAIFGVAGEVIVVYGLTRLLGAKKVSWKYYALVLGTFASFIGPSFADVAAHAGGLACGLVLGFVLCPQLFSKRKPTVQIFSVVAVVLLLAAIGLRQYRGYVIPLGAALKAKDGLDYREARLQLDLALQMNPNSPMANSMAAEDYMDKFDFPNAEAAARRALAVDPDDDDAIYILGRAELQTGRCVDARDLAMSTLMKQGTGSSRKLLPKTNSLFSEKCNDEAAGDLYFNQGQIDKAIESYQAALRSHPESDHSQILLFYAYRAKGMTKEADVLYKQLSAEGVFLEDRKQRSSSVLKFENLTIQ